MNGDEDGQAQLAALVGEVRRLRRFIQVSVAVFVAVVVGLAIAGVVAYRDATTVSEQERRCATIEVCR